MVQINTISISDALLVGLIDSGKELDGTNILDALHRAEDIVLSVNRRELMVGNFKEFDSLTENGRRNILHSKRAASFVDTCVEVASRERNGDLFA